MKKMKKKFSALLLAITCLTLLFGSVSVSADTLDEATKTSMASSVQSFLGQVYVMGDEEVTQLGEVYGGFYEVFADAWLDDKDTVGDFVEVLSTEIDDSDEDEIVATSMVQFTNYQAEVIIYFDATGSSPTNYVMNIEYSFGEKMTQAAENMAVGLLTVFAVLIILIIVISLFRFIPDPSKKAKKAPSDAKDAVPAKQATPASAAAPAAAATGVTSDDNEIAAVIAAAIAAAMADEPSASGYVVRSVRKVGTRRWKRS